MIIPSLKDYVYDFISEEIRNGNLKPNDKIDKANISKQLNISRTPVREALIQLESEGLLQSSPRKGFYVKSLTKKDAEEIYAVLANLDSMAAIESLAYLSEEHLSKMETICKQMNEAILSLSFDEYYRLQVDFHNVYIMESRNNTLIQTIQRLKKRFIRQGYNVVEKEELQNILLKTNEEHFAIVELLRKQNNEEIRAFLSEVHWSLSYAELDSFDD